MAVPPTEQNDTNATKGEPNGNPPPFGAKSPPPQEKPTYTKNEKTTKKWWHTNDFPMLIVTFLGVVAVVAYTCVTRQQLNIMQGQLNATEADQRPWVAIDGDHHSGIVWETRGALLSVFFNLKNVGKSPAADVFFEARPILPKIGGPAIPLDAMKEYAADINRRRATSEMAGEFYFPDHTYQTGMELLIERDDFKALIRDANMADVMPRIIACVSYRIVSRAGFKQTCTSYYVTTTRNDHPGVSFGVGLDVNVPADHVLIGTAFYTHAD